MSQPPVPFNEAAVWLKGLGLWPVGPAHVQATSLALPQILAGDVGLLLLLLWERHHILSNNLNRERFGDEI